MAVIDTTKKKFIQDRDEKIFIGIDLPFHKSDGVEGYFKSTTTTIDAVKNNIKNLLMTHQGERLMRPLFGNPFRQNLYEQMTEDSQIKLMTSMRDLITNWFPYVQISEFRMKDVGDEYSDDSVHQNSVNLFIRFNIRGVTGMDNTIDINLENTDT